MAEPATSFVYFCNGRVLLVSNNVENSEHSHYAMQFTINLEAQPFRICSPQGETVRHAAIVLPNCPHRTIGPDTWRALILIDPQTPHAIQIRQRHAAARGIVPIDGADWRFCVDTLAGFRHEPQRIEQADAVIERIATRFSGPITHTTPADPRIAAMQASIRRAQPGQLNVAWLANQLRISESRLSHLFKREMGIPLQRYLLWYKLAQAAFCVGRGMSLTEAAEAQGFADSAHFSRAFRATFGITPSQVLRRGARVHIVSDFQ
jgi:AraC-like DNA-binding protein